MYLNVLTNSALVMMIGFIVVVIGLLVWIISMYKKVIQGKVLVRTGAGGTRVFFNAGLVVPVLHKMEIMDISVKKLEIDRAGVNGLICKDNIRADIKVAFFVRVNKSTEDIINVAQTIGCERASEIEVLRNLFDAKFSEALKTVGKKFEFIELYEARREFREEIIGIIGTDLNGYVVDDCAIDDLEQTPISYLKPDNILDSEGIKKITELTAVQNIKSNLIKRDEEKTIRKQNVEAREAILALDRQLAEKEEQQKREIANIRSREDAEIKRVSEEERFKAESARIQTEGKVQIAEENKDRQVIVAAMNKQRTQAIETERVEKDRMLEATERERIVQLAQIERDKVLEVERKNIQDVIRDRVILEKGVVQEQENMKDIQAFKSADRDKKVAVTEAERVSEQEFIKRVKAAEAEKEAAKQRAEQMNIDAQAKRDASEKEAQARKIIAEALAKEEAAIGLSEAQVMHAKADALERQGLVDAIVIEKTALAEAAGISAKAEALKTQGITEAEIIKEKALAEASGIEEKAEAMKKLDGVGKEHEEFKLRLNKELQVDLAQINIQKDVADAQALVLSEALKSAKIDIVGGETMFFEHLMNQVTRGKGIDRLVQESNTLTDVKNSVLGDGSENLLDRVKTFADKYGISSETIKNYTVSGLLNELRTRSAGNSEDSGFVSQLLNMATGLGIQNRKL